MTRPSNPSKRRPQANEDEEPAEEVPSEAEGTPEKKERVLHTRVPAVLERELKRFADNLRIPVSNLVRAILEDAMEVAGSASQSIEGRLAHAAEELGKGRERLTKRVLPDPLADVFAYQPVTLAQEAICAKCQKTLEAGDRAHLGLTDAPSQGPKARLFVCNSCLPRS
ncbi:MAG: hypothetical protein IPK82_01200 [Polyangiaceae bacterium]|nr:hypothetical protein [Polyangiaceae bacterium]